MEMLIRARIQAYNNSILEKKTLVRNLVINAITELSEIT